ncbi:hypothetical protein NDR87_15790 [Nocardia sp. CDC159]|uniref:Uncharacterized protein n=1 Tax=Nocardia pulmonis TaxID=2951408 RepID=A0A9X2E803_9NOCA|nr:MULTISPECIES: hypothetical protein [Nocardia]MCM6775444.1 hypothetical protein [Nocardia pulmonis]MCM6787822.1 hypothetical protein [Nocardia sp. CDC159]
MSATPRWVRRNRFVAWAGYFCVLIGFATLAIALTAAGTSNTRWAVLCGGICAGAFVLAVVLIATTVHRDHVEHHATPNLLVDSWQRTPPFVTRRDAPPRPYPRTGDRRSDLPGP